MRPVLSNLAEVVKASKSIRSCARAPGYSFAKFGQKIGLYLLVSGNLRLSLDYLIAPVVSVRYFEFPFAYAALPPKETGRWLDISSPRLFPLYVLHERPASVESWNPDLEDLSVTQLIAKRLKLNGLETQPFSVDKLATMGPYYDCITSISVIEHIDGKYEDREAVRWMSEALRPRGRLILTVPTARQPLEEFRDAPVYPTQRFVEGRGYFFQRWYDHNQIVGRILASMVGMRIDQVVYCGEKEPGVYERYQAQLATAGRAARSKDASWFKENFKHTTDWSQLPGMAVCGIVATKE